MMRTHLSNFKPCFHLRTSWRFNKMMIVYFTCSDSVQFYDAMLGFQLAMQESDLQPCARHLPLGALTFFGWGWRWSKMVLTSCDGPARINSWEDIHATFWKTPLAVQVKPQNYNIFVVFGFHCLWATYEVGLHLKTRWPTCLESWCLRHQEQNSLTPLEALPRPRYVNIILRYSIYYDV